jgi:phospholipase/carboxylesterase
MKEMGRLKSRPRDVLQQSAKGLHELKLERGRDAFLYVPVAYEVKRPAPLVLLLHGAGGRARETVPLLRQLADKEGIILLVPDSLGRTWDVIEGGYGPDVSFIDRALNETFTRYQVNPGHVAIGGFSDGASYALSLGVTNGDLFTHILAFSPGFMVPASRHGSPLIYISHGTEDRVLPIDVCSRRIVRQVKSAGYELQYSEFDGPHTVPREIAAEAVEWFLKE